MTSAFLTSKACNLINAASKLCKIGAHLIYATCSFLKEENETIVENFLSDNINFRVLSPNSIFIKYMEDLLDKDYSYLYKETPTNICYDYNFVMDCFDLRRFW